MSAYAKRSLLPALPVTRNHSMARAVVWPVLSIALATWLLTGVSIFETTRYVAFEVLFVLVPGCMLYALLIGQPERRLRMLAIGWPLGYAIEIGAFALTAALGQRKLFLLLPLAAILTMGPLLLRTHGLSYPNGLRRIFQRGEDTTTERDHRLALLVVGCAVGATLIVLALEFFARYPLPQHTGSVVYYPDNVFDISIAAQARNHWPIVEPYVSGQPLRYYTGFFMHAAAINQVTGVPLATIILRLFPTTVILVIALQLWLLGRELGNSYATGALAVVLFFPVTNLSLDATKFEAFGQTPFYQLARSPTYALGVPFLLGLLALVQRQLAVDKVEGPQPHSATITRVGIPGPLLITGILVLGGTATKTPAIADFVGGLGLFWLWRVISAKDNRLLSHMVMSALCAGIIYHFMLSGGVSSIRIRPFDFMHFTLFVALFPAHSIIGLGLLVCAAAITCSFLFVPSLGALWTMRGRGQDTPFIAFSVAVFAAAAIAYTLLEAAGDGQLFFMSYGSIAIIPVAAVGLTRLWNDTPRYLRAKIARACLIMLTLGLALAASTKLLTPAAALFGWKRTDHVTWLWLVWYIAAYGLVASATAFFSLKLERHYAPAIRSRATRILACAIPLVVTMGLVKSLGLAVPDAWDTLLDRLVTVDSSEHRGMTAALYRGLLWVRDHTSRCDILAVNNHSTSARETDSKYFYYSAFSERSVYLESWAYTSAGAYGGQPFPTRLALNDRALLRGAPDALRELAQQGVSYVLIDTIHGIGAAEPASVSELVFSNSALHVYRLTVPIASRPRRAACGAAAGA